MSNKYCQNCGYELSETNKFCPECGEPVPVERPTVCPGCGEKLSPTAKFCPECGFKLPGTNPIKRIDESPSPVTQHEASVPSPAAPPLSVSKAEGVSDQEDIAFQNATPEYVAALNIALRDGAPLPEPPKKTINGQPQVQAEDFFAFQSMSEAWDKRWGSKTTKVGHASKQQQEAPRQVQQMNEEPKQSARPAGQEQKQTGQVEIHPDPEYLRALDAALQKGDVIPKPPKEHRADGSSYVKKDNKAAYRAAMKKWDDMWGDDEEEDGELQTGAAEMAKDLMERRTAEAEARGEEGDDNEYDRKVELPNDADADYGDPVEYLRNQRRKEQEQQAYIDEEEEDDDEEEIEPTGKKNKKPMKLGDKKAISRFKKLANKDGYYNDRRVADYDEYDDEKRGVPVLTIVLGIVGIAAFAGLMILLQGFLR